MDKTYHDTEHWNVAYIIQGAVYRIDDPNVFSAVIDTTTLFRDDAVLRILSQNRGNNNALRQEIGLCHYVPCPFGLDIVHALFPEAFQNCFARLPDDALDELLHEPQCT